MNRKRSSAVIGLMNTEAVIFVNGQSTYIMKTVFVAIVLALGSSLTLLSAPMSDPYLAAQDYLENWKRRIVQYGAELAHAQGFTSVDEALAAEVGAPFKVFALSYKQLGPGAVNEMRLLHYSFPVIAAGDIRRIITVHLDEESQLWRGSGSGYPLPRDRLALSNAFHQQVPGAEVGVLVLDNRYRFNCAIRDSTLYIAAPAEKEAAQLEMSRLNVLTPIDQLVPAIENYIKRQETKLQRRR